MICALPGWMIAPQVVILLLDVIPLLKSLDLLELIRLIQIVDIFVEVLAA